MSYLSFGFCHVFCSSFCLIFLLVIYYHVQCEPSRFVGCFLFCFDFGFLLSHVSVLFPVCPVVVVTFARVSFSLCLSAPVSPLVLKTFCCVLCGLYYQLLSTVVLRDQMYCSLRKHQQIEKGCRRTKHSGSWIRHKNVSKAHKNKWIQKEKFTKKCNFLCVCFLLLYLFHFCCVLFCLHKPLLRFIQLSLCFFAFAAFFCCLVFL